MTTLSDADIKAEMTNGRLIRNGDPRQIAGACYELRLGNVYYDLTESDHPILVKSGQDILIKPGHRVVLITNEELDVPKDVLARIVSKGSLFSIGLSSVSTYADPGFSGNLGIVTQNMSEKYILLPQMESIAKADFTRLTGPAQSLYSGQHGFQTQIWPIKHHLQKSYAEVKDDPRVRSEKQEAYLLLPQATASMLRELERRQKITDAAILIAILMNALAVFLVNDQMVTNLQALSVNLFSSMIVGFAVIYANRKS